MVMFSRLGHYLERGSVHPVHDPSLGSEIGRKRYPAATRYSRFPQRGRGETSQPRLPKTIMDCMGSPPPAYCGHPRLPSGSQFFNQFVLADRRILKLVYQQMTNTIVERERKIGRGIRVAERLQGALCDSVKSTLLRD